MPINESRRRDLDDLGYARLEGLIDPDRRLRLADRSHALFEEEGVRAGSEFSQEPGARRLARLVDKSDVFVACIAEPGLLAHVAHVLGPRCKLSSLNARSAEPRNREAQPLPEAAVRYSEIR